ncbi:uncharacterized protein BBA_04030 [Beauveria bassiana ARSEF 2860]|uniref:Uncharacterized protein n=1 Tax=Beauveria bassiana (strain ARSEF 2860) TaxID=655819 RepID=J4UNT8_BEAB2|nr:uncharacterized protein BBA_04030 [Beauveria bassiana ARSEF 2860]EJP66737.1 hypothetical protein BBA_04030 [Beauveria bassiana ARSEF 2860]
MAGLAMAVSHEPRMVSSLIDVPNDRCPKGRCMDDSRNRYDGLRINDPSISVFRWLLQRFLKRFCMDRAHAHRFKSPTLPQMPNLARCGGQAAGAYEVATRQLGRVGAI